MSQVIGGVFLLLWAAGCGDDGGAPTLSCVPNLPAQCTPSFDPTFDMLYSSLFEQRCGTSGMGSSCHGSQAKSGGLDLSTPDIAYEALLGGSGHMRVIPNDPACSILVERLESTDPNVRMPRGEPEPLSAGVRCAVQTWIKNGAARR